MIGKDEDGNGQGGFASPPCFIHELDPACGGVTVDGQLSRDVARWRKIERERWIAAHLPQGSTPTERRLRPAR